jgi:hypothetical protein
LFRCNCCNDAQRDEEVGLSDWRAMLYVAVVACMTVAAVLVFVAARKVRARQTELARLRADVNRLSDDVKYLMNAEQRRFLMELKSPQDAKEESKLVS